MKSANPPFDRLFQLFAELLASNAVLADHAVTRLSLLLEDLDLNGPSGPLVAHYVAQHGDLAAARLVAEEMRSMALRWTSPSRAERREQFLDTVVAARVKYLARQRWGEIKSRRVASAAAALALLSVLGAGASMAGAAEDLRAAEFPVDLPQWAEDLLWPGTSVDDSSPQVGTALNLVVITAEPRADEGRGTQAQAAENSLDLQAHEPKFAASAGSTPSITNIPPRPAVSSDEDTGSSEPTSSGPAATDPSLTANQLPTEDDSLMAGQSPVTSEPVAKAPGTNGKPSGAGNSGLNDDPGPPVTPPGRAVAEERAGENREAGQSVAEERSSNNRSAHGTQGTNRGSSSRRVDA